MKSLGIRAVNTCLLLLGFTILGQGAGLAWNSVDIGFVAGDEAGVTSTVTPHSHTVAGGGRGLGGLSDGLRFVSQETTGNLEVDARLASLDAILGAETGVMIRQSTATDAAFAFIGVDSEGELRFKWRSEDGADVALSLGTFVPEGQAVWFRLVRSGNIVAGYYSLNGINWETVGTAIVSMSNLLKAGLAVTSGIPSELVEAEYDHVLVVENIPQRISSPGPAQPAVPILWLRADWNVTYDEGGRVSKWEDFSGFANDAVGTGGGSLPTDNRPLIANDVIGTKPAVQFDNGSLGTLAERKFLKVADHASLNPLTVSIFVVSKWPSAPVGMAGFLSKGGSSKGYTMGFNAGIPRLHIPTNFETFGAALAVDTSYLLEGVFRKADPLKGVSFYANGQMSPLPLTQRTANIAASTGSPLFIGQYLTAPAAVNPTATQAYPFTGEIAEIIIYNGSVTEAQRLQVEAYFKSKYQIIGLPAPKLPDPQFDIATGIYLPGQAVTITSPGSFVYYQINGGEAQLYTGPILLAEGTTALTAWASRPGYADSNAVVVPFIIEEQSREVSRDGLKLWLRSDAGVKTEGDEVVAWRSQVSSLTAQAAGTGRPAFLPGTAAGLNNKPALVFDADWLKVSAPAGSPLALNKHTICVVARPSSSTPTSSTGSMSSLLSRLSATNGYWYGFRATPGSTPLLQLRSRLVLNSGTTGADTLTPLTQPLGTDQWKVLTGLFNLQDNVLQSNGTELVRKGRTASVGDSGTDLFIGAQSASATTLVNPFRGDIAEVIVYDRELEAQELRSLNAYLHLRYQIEATGLFAAVHLETSPAAGLYAVAPTVLCTSQDSASVTYKVNGGEAQPYGGGINLAEEEGVLVAGNVLRYEVKISASKPGFSPVTDRTLVYFVDPATHEVPKEHMKLWLRADIAATPATAPERLITNWNDQSGNGNHLVAPATGVVKPKKVLNALGGQPSISFGYDGLSQMVASAANNQGLRLGNIPNDDVTILAVVKDNGSPDNAIILEQETENDSAGFSLRLRQQGGGMVAEGRFNTSVITAAHSGSPYALPAKFNLFVQRAFPASPTRHVLSVNRTATASQSGYAIDSNNVPRLFSLGARRRAAVQNPSVPLSMPADGLKGEIAELIVLDAAISDLELSRIEAYLISRYLLNSDSHVPLPELTMPEATPDRGMWPSGTSITATHIEGAAVTLTYRIAWGETMPSETAWISYVDGFILQGVGPCVVEVKATKPGYASATKQFRILVDPQITGVPRHNMVLWLAADKDVEKTTVGTVERVTRWKDISGNGHDAVPVTSGSGPDIQTEFNVNSIEYNQTISPGVRKKVPALKFPGANRRMKIDNVQDLADNGTIFVVARSNSPEDPYDRVIMQKIDSAAGGVNGGWNLSYQDWAGKVGFGPLTPFETPPLIAGTKTGTAELITGHVGSGLRLLGTTNETKTASWSGGNVGDDLIIGGSFGVHFSATTTIGSAIVTNILPQYMQRLGVEMTLSGNAVGGYKISEKLSTTSIRVNNNNTSSSGNKQLIATSYMNGEIAEIIIYSNHLDEEATKAVHTYLMDKYHFQVKPALSAPTIQVTPSANSIGGVFTESRTVTITSENNSTIEYRVDGGDPQTAVGRVVLTVGTGETRKVISISAICSKTGYSPSTEAHAMVIIDPDADYVPRSKLKLWVRGDSAATTSPESNTVARWIDLSGYGHHLTKPAPVAVNSPVKTTPEVAGFNGHPVIKFTKEDHHCLEGNYPGLDGENISVFAILRTVETENATTVIAEKHLPVTGTATDKGYSLQLINGAVPKFNFRTRETTLAYTSSDTGHPVVLVGGTHGDYGMNVSYQGNNVSSKVFSSNSKIIPSTTTPFYVGGRKAVNNFDGEIAELWVYDGELSQEDINLLSIYAHRRYGTQSNKQVPAPVADYEGGTYSTGLKVKVSCLMDDVTIRYELGDDGETEVDDPSETSPELDQDDLTGQVSINGAYRVLKVVASKAGLVDSAIQTWVYRIQPDKSIVRRGLVAWYKGDRGVATDSNFKVTHWIDQSGMGNDAAAPNETVRPLYVTDPLEAVGLPVIRFNQAGLKAPLTLQVPHPLRFPDERAHFETMSVVAVMRKLGTNIGVVVKKGGYQLNLAGSATAPTASLKIGTPAAIAVPIRQNVFETIAGTYDRITRRISTGDSLKSATGTAAIAQDTKPIYIGSFRTVDNNDNLQGEIAEMLIYNTGLSEAERQQMERYLSAEYGIYNAPALTVEKPRIVPGVAGGTLELAAPGEVAIIGTSDNAIYYTTDPLLGGMPSTTTWTLYSQPIHVGFTTTIWAFSRKEGLAPVNSDTTTATFELDEVKFPAPHFDEDDETPPVITLEKPTNAIDVTD
ncbi:chitobiase/beta-hexosaminidase-like protein [Prosthecobacter fusiformis]|uniref:Chitobiase/beta-hexosaminidase-like protein n=1 Tax=Prosthecobacter fusiformis TaxID=48464 RepID=A0A4R7SQU1_9BACT|nr:LamG-like jellyroll fold domain-containing protein [Prosthecobacter fusiformis]TDU80786.1 chitobiase/beta-hexosaminidase-like protein [Prosthecobacter fusiformis]